MYDIERSLLKSSAFQFTSRVSIYDGPRLDIVKDGRACTDDNALTNDDAGANEAIGTDPGVVTDLNREAEQRHFRRSVIVAAGAEVGLLRYGNPLPDRHFTEVVNEGAFADGR